MNKLFSALLLLFVSTGFSCNNSQDKQFSELESSSEIIAPPSDEVFRIDRTRLTKDYKAWYNYTYYNVPLSRDFIGLDTDSATIDKSEFLNKLIDSNLVALKIRTSLGKPVYKLVEIENEHIHSTMKQLAEIEMHHFKMEGTELPAYNFTDLYGNKYDNASTKGKLVVLKCWFIACVACVKEFPDLNNLVDKNKDRNDLLFISLAMDPRQDLIPFLKTKEFKYAVIPETKSFMLDKMHINIFPTHLLIDRNGKIVKVVNKIEELIPFIEIEKMKT